MIKHTAVSTDVRKQNIMDQVNMMKLNRSGTLAEFGIRVDDGDFIKAPARQLFAPKIQYSDGTVTPMKGAWQMQMGNKDLHFIQPADCLKWCVLNTDNYLDQSKVDTFVSMVWRFCVH